MREETGKVPAAVEHPYNVDTASGTTIENEIIPYGEAPQTGCELVTLTPHARVGCQQGKPLRDRIY